MLSATYYSKLNNQEIKCYNAIYNDVCKFKFIISVPYGVTCKSISAVANEHPELFFWNHTSYKTEMGILGTSVILNYLYSDVKDCRTKIGDISACVMCSDGVRNSFDTEEHFNGFCKTLANAFANDTENTFEQDMQTFLSELTANGSGDDVSVGIITV